MSNVPSNRKYAQSHEWAMDNGDGTVTIGISDHAQELLGDVVFVELPEVGAEVEAGSEFSLVESVKAASDIYAPVSGEIVEVNEALDDSPEMINEEPFDGAWIAKVKMSDASQLDALLDAAGYEAKVAEED
ncbi:MAG: glycine cleavage system protein GcvH [Pseudomonadales bacterium]